MTVYLSAADDPYTVPDISDPDIMVQINVIDADGTSSFRQVPVGDIIREEAVREATEWHRGKK